MLRGWLIIYMPNAEGIRVAMAAIWERELEPLIGESAC
jgi:hypothetical protein